MSRKYGGDPRYVLAGGGNTSYKAGGVMAVKASGHALSTIGEDGFVLMDVERLRALTEAEYPEGDKAREACALKDMMDARLEGEGDKRPSVECILHALFRKAYVLHVHPSLVNGLTCGRDGTAAAEELFCDIRESFLWVPLIKPGYILSRECSLMFEAHAEAYGEYPSIVLLQNHGVFVAADTTEEADRLMAAVMGRVSGRVVREPAMAPATNGCSPGGGRQIAAPTDGTAIHLYNEEIACFTASREAYAPLMKPFTPDHIVYCRAYPVFADSPEQLPAAFAEYEAAHGYKPKIAAVKGQGVFALGKDEGEAGLAAELYIDAVKVAVYSESFGGPLTLPDEFTDFIVNWESESYRQNKSF